MSIKEKGLYSKNKIIETAEICFRDKDVESVTIDEICNRAGLTRGAFYHHFENKQHLLSELYKKWTNNFSNIFKNMDMFKVEDVEAEKIFLSVIDYSLPIFKQTGKELTLFLELNIKAIRDKKLRKYISDDQKNFINFFSFIIGKSKKEGLLKDIKPEDISRILFAFILGFSIMSQQNPKDTDWVNVAKSTVKLIFN